MFPTDYMFFYKDPYIYDPKTNWAYDKILNRLKVNLAYCLFERDEKRNAEQLLDFMKNPDQKTKLNRLALAERYKASRKLRNKCLDSVIETIPTFIPSESSLVKVNPCTPRDQRKQLREIINKYYKFQVMMI